MDLKHKEASNEEIEEDLLSPLETTQQLGATFKQDRVLISANSFDCNDREVSDCGFSQQPTLKQVEELEQSREMGPIDEEEKSAKDSEDPSSFCKTIDPPPLPQRTVSSPSLKQVEETERDQRE